MLPPGAKIPHALRVVRFIAEVPAMHHTRGFFLFAISLWPAAACVQKFIAQTNHRSTDSSGHIAAD
jgi:hypothetical protein